MIKWFSTFLDRASEFLAHRKGFLPLVGILLIVLNFILSFFPELGWISTSDFFLHLGVILTIFGFLLAQAL